MKTSKKTKDCKSYKIKSLPVSLRVEHPKHALLNQNSRVKKSRWNIHRVVLTVTAFFLSVNQGFGQDFRAIRDGNGDAYVQWETLEGYSYTLQSSDDLQFLTSDSEWIGHGQTVSVLVQEGTNVGGGGGAIPGNPYYHFLITDYPNGDSLISWSGEDGNPYQLYTTDTYFQIGDPPLFQTTIDDPVQDYSLFLIRASYPLPPNAASLTLAALPQIEQDQVTQLTSQRAQVVADIASNGGTNSQTGAVSANVGDAGFFRLLIFREDSDGDGLYNNLETDFGLNPYDPDTDQDGVTDPWDHANIGHVIISEFMASNSATIRDGNQPGVYEDYIELFNPTSSTVNLSGHFLSCNASDPLKWSIPAGFILAPGQSRLVFASDNDETDPEGNPHTNFRLSASGEDLLLSAPNGALIDSHLEYGRQRTNASAGWGLDQETGLVSALRFFLDPTPGMLNSPESCTGFSEAPVFNINGGVFSNTEQTVIISPAIAGIPGEQIHYTRDGSNPTVSSPLYTEPLLIDSTTIVRAISVIPGCIPSPIHTRSFLYKEDMIGTGGQAEPAVDAQVRPADYQPSAWNMNNLLGPLDYEMDPQVIPDHYDVIFNELSAIPTIAISLPEDDIFGAVNGFYAQSDATINDDDDPQGTEWQRLASFEYIDPNNPAAYSNENGEITISGNSSRRNQITRKHNLRLRFRARNSLLGSPTFSFNVSPFTNSPVQDFVQMQLRNPTHDSWAVNWFGLTRGAKSVAIREAWARNIHDQMEPIIQDPNGNIDGNLIANRRWVHLYLNGLYWGVYDLTERVDEGMARSYGDPNADYDVISNSGVVDGDMTAYNLLVSRAIAAAAAPGDVALWQAVENMLDCDNYVDYIIVNTFMHNTDWPGNNWRAMRRRAVGAQFKFIIWDAELSFDSNNLMADRTGQSVGAARLHGILRNHPQYQQVFKDRVALHFDTPGGAFSVNNGIHQAAEIFQTEMDEFKKTLFSESARWGDSVRSEKAYTFIDPTSFPMEDDIGDWDRTSRYHRDFFYQTQTRNL